MPTVESILKRGRCLNLIGDALARRIQLWHVAGLSGPVKNIMRQSRNERSHFWRGLGTKIAAWGLSDDAFVVHFVG